MAILRRLNRGVLRARLRDAYLQLAELLKIDAARPTAAKLFTAQQRADVQAAHDDLVVVFNQQVMLAP